MTLERPFHISVFTLVGTAMASLALALGSPTWLLIGPGLFAGYLLLSVLRPGWRLRRGIATLGVLFVALGVLVEVVSTATVLVPAAHFLILTQLIWLSQERTNRNYGWLCLTSLFQMMLAGVLTVDLFFGLCFAIYLPAGVATLLLLNLRCELERSGLLTPSRVRQERIGARLLVSAGLVVLAEAVLSIVVFVYFPRFGLQVLQLRPIRRGPALTGFGDRVRFGDLARILENPEVVMSVTILRRGKPARVDDFPLYWRGTAHDTYEKATWSTSAYMRDARMLRLPFPGRRRGASHAKDIIQDIALEPVSSRVLFYLPHMVELRSATPNLDAVIYHEASRTISSARSSAVSLRYIVHSRRPAWLLKSLRRRMRRPATEYLHGSAGYIQLPDSLTPRLRLLAQRIARGNPANAVYDRARAIESYLRTHFRYSLEPGRAARDVDPVEDFLFHRSSGHCEYFAAAMVLLLRCLDIPARMVTGFRGGEWNEYGQFYVVRQQNAHAWVEVFVPSVHNWVAFDPTPAFAPPATPGDDWLSGLWRRLAHVRLAWNSFIVNYSSRDQEQLAQVVTRFLSRLSVAMPFWGSEGVAVESGYSIGIGTLVAIWGGVVVLVVLAFLGFRLGRRARRRWRRARRSGRPTVGFYRKMDDILRRRGFRREPATTPLEFAHEVVAAGGERYAPVEVVTDAFCQVRYGGRRLGAVERTEVSRALSALERKKS